MVETADLGRQQGVLLGVQHRLETRQLRQIRRRCDVVPLEKTSLAK
jgi:hypothetical protein